MLFKKTIIVALFSACFTLSAQVSTNQTGVSTNETDVSTNQTGVSTNLIYSTAKDASVTLTAVVQTADGGTTKVRVANKDVFALLNATGDFNFTNHPQLLMRSDDAAQPYFVVRDSGTNEFDVSAYLTVTAPDDAVHGRNQMVNYEIWNVTLSVGGDIDFTFWGLTTLHTGKIPTGNRGFLERTVSLESVGSGPGHINGANAQFTGKFTANHAKIDSLPINTPVETPPD